MGKIENLDKIEKFLIDWNNDNLDASWFVDNCNFIHDVFEDYLDLKKEGK